MCLHAVCHSSVPMLVLAGCKLGTNVFGCASLISPHPPQANIHRQEASRGRGGET